MAFSRAEEDAKKVSMWLEWLEDEAKSIPQVLYDCFNYVGMGLELSVVHDNTLELVKFAAVYARESNDIPSREAKRFLDALESMATKLEMSAKERATYEAEVEALWARSLYKDACEDIGFFKYCNIYDLILGNWEALKDWCGTYKMLMGLVRLQSDWEDSDAVRFELAHVIKEMADEW